jgi:hypothetical protein
MQGRLFYDMASVRQEFQHVLKKGEQSDCPCCGRHAQLYRRTFHSSMAVQLIRMYQLGGCQKFTHASKLILPGMSGSGDFSKAKYWGLIVPKDKAIYDTDTPSKANGFWRMTPAGQQFVNGLIAIPMDVTVFADEVLAESRQTITIREALGTKFNYDELMEARA